MSDWQIREMARFDPDGPDLRIVGPPASPQYCEECGARIGPDDEYLRSRIDRRTLCGACWAAEEDELD
ncbi:MAG: hypothetical protein IRZ03_18260 [Acidobacterium ailaaui]|nr:hypothetical protein [Pseudacidobacterium ailaaui]